MEHGRRIPSFDACERRVDAASDLATTIRHFVRLPRSRVDVAGSQSRAQAQRARREYSRQDVSLYRRVTSAR